jgi:hypothetical protein
VYNVSSAWSDGKTRKEDVSITYIPAGKARSGRYDHSDNYSRMQGRWTFDSWKWSTSLSDL